MRVATTLTVALLASAAFMTGLAQGIHTPWPTVDFDRENPPAILSFYGYVNSDRGQEFLLWVSVILTVEFRVL